MDRGEQEEHNNFTRVVKGKGRRGRKGYILHC